MKDVWALAREYKVEYALFAVVALVFGFLPYAQTIYEMKGQWLSASPTLYVSGVYYTDRIQEVVDGYPLIGNPYFLEHRDEFPPAFFVADWLGAIPLFLGIPMVPALLTNIVIWSFALFLLLHALFVTLGASSRLATIGSIVLGAQVFAQMVQPVSMQIVYPFFILFLYAYLLWLEDPRDKTRQIVFAVSTALCAYIYTYSIQIVAVLYALVGAWIILRERVHFVSYVRTSIIGVVLCVPLIVFSLMQIQHEWYFETLERIGLIRTHLPVTLAFYVTLIPLAFVGLGAMIGGRTFFFFYTHRVPPRLLFLGTTGLALVFVMFSNVITGTDLELPQHIERFIVVWLMCATMYTLGCHRKDFKELLAQFPKNILVLVCIFIILYSYALHLKNGGPQSALRPARTAADIERLEGLDTPLRWLRENVHEPTVIWADPDGVLNNLIPTYTQHYVLFEPKGVLQLLSNKEMEERYLLAHYFELDKEELIREYVQYAGTGNAVHAYKTHNKRVKICRLLHGDGYDCGKETDMVGYKGEAYFDGLLERYAHEIRGAPLKWLENYNVKYIVFDRQSDSSSFDLTSLYGVTRVFDDGRFLIYKMSE